MATIIVASFAVKESKAQTVNGVRLSELKATYIEIRIVKRILSDKLWISLEYGQKVIDSNNNTYIKDDNNKELEFNSALDCVNK